jgi:REP-associated tyrosine transposase
VALDRLLDTVQIGPMWLRRPDIAELVIGALLDAERRFHRYQLHAFVVMSNHVHLLVTPEVVATKWLGPLKGSTAYRANLILNRKGPFWQDESYDHLVRDSAEFESTRRYIELNPVRAGLVAAPEEFKWSSAAQTLAA